MRNTQISNYIAYIVVVAALILLISTLVYFVNNKFLSISEGIQGFLAGALVIITALYAYETMRMSRSSEKSLTAATTMVNETKKQRLDSWRPVLVPTLGWGGVAPGTRNFICRDPSALLRLRNIGVGPALNIRVHFEQRVTESNIVCTHKEEEFFIEPIEINENGLVRLCSNQEKFGSMDDNIWIIIKYEDIFRQKFITEGNFIKPNNTWANIRIQEFVYE